MRERVKRLRDESLSAVPELSIERALIVTEVYKEYQGKVSTPVLRALVFKALMEKKAIYIGEGELIVGERGERPKRTPTYPELCCHSLEDFQIINDREKTFFRVDDDARRAQAETIIPYWEKRSMRYKLFSQMSKEWIDCYEAGIFTEFMEQRARHTVLTGRFTKRLLISRMTSSGPSARSTLEATKGPTKRVRTQGYGYLLTPSSPMLERRKLRQGRWLECDDPEETRTPRSPRCPPTCQRILPGPSGKRSDVLVCPYSVIRRAQHVGFL